MTHPSALTIDTPAFRDLLKEFADWQDEDTRVPLIAHINAALSAAALGAQQAEPGDGAIYEMVSRRADPDAHDAALAEALATLAAPAATAAPKVPEVVQQALDIALDLATAEADNVHRTYAGYKPHRHEAVDRDVETVKRAIDAINAAAPTAPEATQPAAADALFNGFNITKLPPILTSCVAKLWPGSNGLFWEVTLEKMPERIEHLMAKASSPAPHQEAEGSGQDAKPCGVKLAPGQWWNFCGETDMGQTAPALCTACGGEYTRAAMSASPATKTEGT